MNSTSAALASFGRSCWVQRPQPGSIWIPAQSRNEVPHVREQLLRAGEGDNEVTITRHIEGRYRDLQAGYRPRDFPIAIDVAVLVQRSAKNRCA
jgi:hypothetical protein